jgi:N-acyl homoserine lactone hydrolase
MKKFAYGLMSAALLSSGLVCAAGTQEAGAALTLTRLDCGTILVNELNAFSDTMAYTGKSKTLTDSCYLIKHGDEYMLWDTGLPVVLKGKPFDAKQPMSATLNRTLLDQLGELNVDAQKIKYVGVSHYHFDHIGQLPDFANSTLLIGKGDWDAVSASVPPEHVDPKPFAQWIAGKSKVDPVSADRDVFGDGQVVLLSTPGHTPGHHSLLIRLALMGPVILTGDATHFAENFNSNGVPTFNTDRADTLASLDRIKALAKNLGATVVIQHEAADIAKLPAFPTAAR